MTQSSDVIESFGFEKFWPLASERYADVFPVIQRLIDLMNEMLDAADKKRTGELELSIRMPHPYDGLCYE